MTTNRFVALTMVSIVVVLLPFGARGAVVYSQPPAGAGVLLQSSWWDPNDSDYDQYVWDDFVLGSTEAITEIGWHGGYDPGHFGTGGPVVDFTVEVWSSIQAGTQPDIASVFTPNPLVQFATGGNAGETPAGTFGGVAMYDYHVVLPTPFQAAAGTRYWVQIEAAQHGIPDWGLAAGTNGSGSYFRRIANVGDIFYQTVSGDAAFTLLSAGPPSPTDTPIASGTATPAATTHPATTATPTATAPTILCVGDCDGSGAVHISELVTGVNIVLGNSAVNSCPAFENGAGEVDIVQLIKAVNNVLNGCA